MSSDLIEFLVRVLALLLLGAVWGWALHELRRYTVQALRRDDPDQAWRELVARLRRN